MWSSSPSPAGILRRAAVSALALALSGASPAAAILAYVTSYAGTLTTLNLAGSNSTLQTPGKNISSITQVAVNDGCGPNASWLTLDKANGILYCLDENFDKPNGTLSAYRTNDNGTLTQLNKTLTPGGPVNAVLYGEGKKGLAVASYAGGAFSSYLKDPASLAEIESLFFTLSKPGANATRQEASHPHQVILDPSGDYFLVPDLGADLVRVYAINQTSLEWQESEPLVTPPGSGPRHAAFVVHDNSTYMYLTSELANTVTGYSVEYKTPAPGSGSPLAGLTFKQIYRSGSLGPNSTVPAAATAAEVVASPDRKFIIVSTRNDRSYNIDAANATYQASIAGPSDTLTTFAVDPDTGVLSHVENYAAGGLIPRQFSISKSGDVLGVGMQGSSRVVFIRRDVQSGKFLGYWASFAIAGEVTSVVFDE